MAIVGTTTNYTGRTKDINILLGANASIPDRQPVTVAFGRVSSFCAGIQKLMQRYLVAFCTIIGSQPNYPTFGTDFMSKLESGGRYSQTDIYHMFNFANSDVTSDFMEYQRTATVTLPDDEQLMKAELLDFSAIGDVLQMRIQLTSKQGDSVTFVVPIPISR